MDFFLIEALFALRKNAWLSPIFFLISIFFSCIVINFDFLRTSGDAQNICAVGKEGTIFFFFGLLVAVLMAFCCIRV